MIGHFLKICLCALLLSGFAAARAFPESAWDMNFPLPSGDPRWQEVKSLWDTHWDGKNINELLGVLNGLEKTGADPLATSLWLAQAYYLKARFQDSKRAENFKRAEYYAAKAVSLDDGSMTAIKLLITSVSSYADLDYIKKPTESYGQSGCRFQWAGHFPCRTPSRSLQKH
jgi:hypothetical protein